MRRFGLLALLLCFAAWAGGCAHFTEIDELPAAYRTRLLQHPLWLTVARFENPPRVFPPADAAVIKKWSLLPDEDGQAGALRELVSSSFVGLLTKARSGQGEAELVNLRGAIDPTAFFAHDAQGQGTAAAQRPQTYQFVPIDARRFEILVNGGAARIVFVPAPNDYYSGATPVPDHDVGLWATPFGPEGEVFGYLRGILGRAGKNQVLPPNQRFLHHELNIKRHVSVLIDRSFPESFLPTVTAAISKWNKALGQELYELPKARTTIGPGDCLTGFELCFRWRGSSDIAFTGASGFTELSFDPQTGLIMGALVTVINEDVPPLTELPASERERITSGHIDWDWVTHATLRYGDYDHYRHPLAADFVEHVLVHEIGHANGLGHNFYAANDTTLTDPVRSVMSYPPFPIGHLAKDIAAFDKERLALLYTPLKAPPLSALKYCSTFDALAPDREQGRFQKSAHCEMFTVGDPAEFYMRLARLGRYGVFTPYPDLSRLSDELRSVYRNVNERRGLPPLNLLTRLGFLLGDGASDNTSTRRSIEAYLCALNSQNLAITAQLKDYHQVQLHCPNNK